MRILRKKGKLFAGILGLLVLSLVALFSMLCCIPKDAFAQPSPTCCLGKAAAQGSTCHTSAPSRTDPQKHCPMQEASATLKSTLEKSDAVERFHQACQKYILVTLQTDILSGPLSSRGCSSLHETSIQTDSPPLYIKNSILRI